MADMVSKENRSEIMSHVTGKETKPEKIGRKYLFAQGLRYRKKCKTVVENSGYRSSKVQGCNIREWLFLAWTSRM